MKSKLASLILFTSIVSVTQICCAGETKYAPIVQARPSTVFESAFEKNEGTSSSSKSTSGSKLVSWTSCGK